jgi:hypothetical protein
VNRKGDKLLYVENQTIGNGAASCYAPGTHWTLAEIINQLRVTLSFVTEAQISIDF